MAEPNALANDEWGSPAFKWIQQGEGGNVSTRGTLAAAFHGPISELSAAEQELLRSRVTHSDGQSSQAPNSVFMRRYNKNWGC